MERIIDGRGTGKTKKLLEYAWSTGATIACSNPLAMKDKAHSYGLYGLKIISYKDCLYQPFNENIVIDELERILPKNIIGYTITNEE